MERGSILRWLVIGVALFVLLQFGMPSLFGDEGSAELQPLQQYTSPPAEERAEERLCDLSGPRFDAVLSTRGASLRSVRMKDEKYKKTIEQGSEATDLVTTKNESFMPLRTDLRAFGADDAAQQVPFNNLDWTLESATSERCAFVYESADTKITKVVSTTDQPFELTVELTVENKAASAKKHRLTIEQASFRTAEEVTGSLGMLSEFHTKSEVASATEVERFEPGDFEPEDFAGEGFTGEGWFRIPGEGVWASTSSSYFAAAVLPVSAPAAPAAEALIEMSWDSAKYKTLEADPTGGHIYRSRLAYPEAELAAGQTASYKALAFVGPKERSVLATVGHTVGLDPQKYRTGELLDLGFFGSIGKLLVGYVYYLYGLVGSWGWAIVLLTITVKTLLFPLSIAQIKSSFAMRRLKPEMDEINEKYKNDTAQRGLALQELWRREKVANPVIGCIPVMLQMPVWFALYTVLQTAVELYHTPFGPVIPDLSQPGLYYIIPLVLGASSFFQQKLMPPQGDPTQQKMMLYMLPIVFTVMMLFLPAGLGVYMLTNTWLGIIQQVLVERWMQSRLDRAKTAAGGAIEVREVSGEGKKDDGGDSDQSRERSALSAAPALGKGKARVRG